MQVKLIQAYEKHAQVERFISDVDSSLAFEIAKVLNEGEVNPRIKIGERFTSH